MQRGLTRLGALMKEARPSDRAVAQLLRCRAEERRAVVLVSQICSGD